MLALASDNELAFSYVLAEKLHMTVAEMEARMDHREYLLWSAHFALKAQRRQVAGG